MTQTLRVDELGTTASDTNRAHEEIARLASAMANGMLDERGDPTHFSGADGELIATVNTMLDTLVSPLRLASDAIDKIAHGSIPLQGRIQPDQGKSQHAFGDSLRHASRNPESYRRNQGGAA